MAPDNVTDWLEGLGLGRYADTFAANDVGPDVLPHLTEEHLRELGVSLGDRLRMLSALSSSAGPPAAPSPAQAVSTEAEHRQVTVMFCDLVGSTALSERIDIEDYREVLGGYQGRVSRTLARHGGYLARYMGDGVLGYFGYPVAHEDDAERALRAGLAIVEEVRALPAAGGVSLDVRIGIATGHVVAGDVVGEGAAEEHTVLGETPNLAARLQALAAPGCVLIADSTRRLTGRLFDYETSGPHVLKGFSTPIPAWRVLRELSGASRFSAIRRPDEGAPLVGRDSELAVLADRWQRALAAEGQVVLLGGEAGIGKSRLAHALRTRVRADSHALILLQCSAHYANTAFHPFLAETRRAAGLAHAATDAERLDRLERWTAAVGLGADAAAFFARALSLPDGGRYPASDLHPSREKDRLVELLTERLRVQASQTPVLLIVEDLHWADPTTLETLDALVDAAPSLPLLAVLTHRPELAPRWSGRGHVTAHSLTRLGRRQVAEVVTALAGDTSLPDTVVQAIVARADGVPLFVEELTRSVIEARSSTGDGAGSRPRAVPSTLQDSLAGRLDRLGDAKAVAQIAAVIGREFAHELLKAVVPLTDTALARSLDVLEGADIVHQRRPPPAASYSFRHALVQDAAYDSLLKPRRQRLHAAVARALSERFPEIAAREPEVVAHHYAAGDMPVEAIDHWQRAARAALARSAYAESRAHLESALKLVSAHPRLASRRERELELRIALAGALLTTHGYPADETMAAFQAALALAREVGDEGQVFTVLRGLHGVHFVRAELDTALAVARECLDMAESIGDPESLALAHRLLGQTLCMLGELTHARQHLERSSGYDADVSPQGTAPVLLAGGGHRVFTPAFLAHVSWLEGEPDRALTLARRAAEDADERYGAFTRVASMFFLAWILAWRRDHAALAELVARQRALAAEHEISEWISTGELLAALAAGDREAARAWVERVRTAGGLRAPLKLALLGDALAPDDPDLALGLVEEARAETERTGERWCEAELLRLEASVLARIGEPEARIEQCLERALETSARQGARAWTLRTATALARLRQQQGREAEGRALLDDALAPLTEGLDTPDVREARALHAAMEGARQAP